MDLFFPEHEREKQQRADSPIPYLTRGANREEPSPKNRAPNQCCSCYRSAGDPDVALVGDAARTNPGRSKQGDDDVECRMILHVEGRCLARIHALSDILD